MAEEQYKNEGVFQRLQKDKNDQQWAMMGTILSVNGNKEDVSPGFGKGGSPGHPKNNPFEMDINDKEKEDLTWLLG